MACEGSSKSTPVPAITVKSIKIKAQTEKKTRLLGCKYNQRLFRESKEQ